MSDRSLQVISIGVANKIGLSKVLRKAEDTLVFLTKRDRPVLLVQGLSSLGLENMRALMEEARGLPLGFNDDYESDVRSESGEQFEELSEWEEQIEEWKDQFRQHVKKEAGIEGDPVVPKVSVSEANRQGISWVVQTTEEEGILYITRHGKMAALLMPFTPEGIQRYEEQLQAMADRREKKAYERFRQEMDQVQKIREGATYARYHLLPEARELSDPSDSED